MSAPVIPANAVADPDGPVNAVQTPEGHRWYPHPVRRLEDGSPEVYVSVTTALDAMSSPGLPYWYGKQAANFAAEQLPRLLKAVMVKPCTGGPERCEECRDCVTRWIAERGMRESARRSQEGRDVHYALKVWINTGMVYGRYPAMSPEVKVYFDQIVKAFKDLGVTYHDVLLCETTVINRTHGYAGTLDLMVRIRGSHSPAAADLVARLTGWPAGEVVIVVDVKTREREESAFYPDMGLQMKGYRSAELIMYPDGSEDEMPATDGAVLLQVRPDGYEPRVVDDVDGDFEGFLHHLAAFRWQCERGGKIVGKKSRPLPDEMQGTCAAGERVCKANDLPPKIAKEQHAILKARANGLPDPEPKPARRRATAGGTKAATAKPAAATARPATAKKPAATADDDPFKAAARAVSVPGARLTDDDIPF